MKQSSTNFLIFNSFCVLFFVIFNYTLTIIASLYIVGDLGGSNYTTTYTIVFYILGNALGIPLGKPLAECFGIRKSLAFCLLFFALFSWLCAASPNFPAFITFRLVQGLMGGPFFVLIDRIFSSVAQESNKKLLTSLKLMIYACVPILGASFGGWIAYDYDWRLVFYIELPFILFLAVYFFFRLKNYEFTYENTPFDLVGYLSYFIGVFCLCIAFTTGQELDWFRSPLFVGLTMAGIPFFIFFILWEFVYPHPILNLQFLKNPIFSFALINLAVLYSAYFGMIILLSLWLHLYVFYTPLWIAVLIGNMALAAILPGIFIVKEFGLLDTRIPLSIAIIFLALSCFYTATFDIEVDFAHVAHSRVLAGIGLALFLPPIFRLAFFSFPANASLEIVSLFHAVRTIASGLGAGFYIILWQRRQIFFHERLGSQLTAFSMETKQFFKNAKQLVGIQGQFADARLEFYLDRQATSLALDDCFWLMGWILVGLLVLMCLTFFFPKEDFFPEKKRKREALKAS